MRTAVIVASIIIGLGLALQGGIYRIVPGPDINYARVNGQAPTKPLWRLNVFTGAVAVCLPDMGSVSCD